MFKRLVLFSAAVIGLAAAAYAAPRPNIILCMADDMGWGDPGYNSATVTFADGTPHPDQGWINTPAMDAMAANGLQFNRFYSASSVCSPTRASCLTGRNPVRVGIGNANNGRLGFDETPLSEILSDVGYVCGHFGKWHMGTLTTLRDDGNRGAPGNTADYSAPWHHAYDTCFATESKVPTYHPYSGGTPLITSFSDPGFYGTRYWRIPAAWNETSGEGEVVPVEEVNNPVDGDDSKLLVDQAIPFMQEAVSNNAPFFLVLWFHTPHKPIVDPNDPNGKVNTSDGAKGAIEDMDEAIARVRDELTALGVRSNTMFWVTSDNGPENGVDSHNETQPERSMRAGRYRDRKGTFYEGGIIVPGILEWPEAIPAGMSTDVPAVTSDYYPTILDYLELSVPDQKPLDGISLRPYIEGTVTARARPIGFKKGGDRAWIDNQYKLVKDGPVWELYDLVNVAPGEEPEQSQLANETNVTTKAQAIQDLYNSMLAEFSAWETTVNSDTPYVHSSQPTVALSTPSGSVASPFTVTATFSENVTQLNADEFVVVNGTPSNLSGSGTSWTVTITPAANGTVSVSLPEGCAIDDDGNINASSGTLNVTYANNSAPDVSLSTPDDPVTNSFTVTAAFTEDVTGLDVSDFEVTNGSATNLAGGPAVYTVTIVPAAAGTVSVFLPGGAAQDGESNGNNASTLLSVTYADPSAPGVTLSTPLNTVSSDFVVTATFTENVSGLNAADFEVTNGTASNLNGGPAVYTVTVQPVSAGSVAVGLPAGAAQDGELNQSTAANTLNITYNPPEAPAVILSGPSAVSAASAGDFAVTNGTASGLSGGGASYSVIITPAGAGVVTVSLPAGLVTDLDDGLANTASAPLVTTYTPPGGGGSVVETILGPAAGQTADSIGNVPGDQSNNIFKFTEGNDGCPYTTTNLFVRASSNAERKVRAFVRFDLSPLGGQPVAYATLNFNGYSLNNSANNATDIEVVALASDWSETGAPLPAYEQTTAGSAVNGGSVITGLDGNRTRDYSFDITEMARNWTDGTWNNHGLRVQLTMPSENNGVGIKTEGAGAIQLLVGTVPLTIHDSGIGPGAHDFTLQWNTAPGLMYGVQAATNLTDAWEVITNLTGSFTGTNSYTFEGDASLYTSRFYRVVYPAGTP
jgi:arylsulfatase A-like enzyme